MNLVLYTGLFGGYSNPPGAGGIPPQDRLVKGIVQVSDYTKAHCVYLVPQRVYVSLPWPQQRLSLPSRGEAGRPPHLQIIT